MQWFQETFSCYQAGNTADKWLHMTHILIYFCMFISFILLCDSLKWVKKKSTYPFQNVHYVKGIDDVQSWILLVLSPAII